MTCLSPRVFVKRFYEDSTSNNTKHVAVVVVVIIIITTEIKRTCTYSQGAQESSTEKKKKKRVFNRTFQFLGLSYFLVLPSPLAILLPQALATSIKNQKVHPADTKGWDECSWRDKLAGPRKPTGFRPKVWKSEVWTPFLCLSFLNDFHMHEPCAWCPMALEIQSKLFSLLGEAGCPVLPLLTSGSKSECIMKAGVANPPAKTSGKQRTNTDRAESAVLRAKCFAA